MAEGAPPAILHLHSGFNLGGKEARAVRLMNLWGERARHTVISADHDAMNARAAISPKVQCNFPMDAAPSLHGLPDPRRYWRWARYMQRFDLVLTYNWGAMDAVMAHRIHAPFLRLPPLIHHEDGFNEDEIYGLKSKRNIFRRLALARACALVVPSRRLQHIARSFWHQPESKVRLIYNGINAGLYVRPPASNAIPGFTRPPGKLVVGTLAGLRPVKNLPRLVRALAPLRDKAELLIVGEGPERQRILSEAATLGLAVHLPGFLPDPWKYVGLFDIFALSSDSEQFPISLIEAMAAGLPVVSTDVGDVMTMVGESNRPYVVPCDDEPAMTAAFTALIHDESLRRRLGSANRSQVAQQYRESDMVVRYAALYGKAMGHPHILME